MSKSKQTFRVTGRKTIETSITKLVVRKYQIHLFTEEQHFRLLPIIAQNQIPLSYAGGFISNKKE